MSFILDALRKSEHERQRQTGPALAEMPVAAPRPRSNVWAPIAIALLLVNLLVVGVWLLRKSTSEPALPPPAVAATDDAPDSAGAARRQPDPTSAGAAGSPLTAAVPPPPMLRPAEPVAAPVHQGRNPLEAETASGPPALDPRMTALAAAVPEGPAAVTSAPTSRGSVVYESLPDSATVGGGTSTPQPGTSRPPSSAGAGLPSADQLAAAGIPALNLDLHVYATIPAQRLVFINARKYREGETLQEGPVVSEITPTGVVLEYQGRSYLLTHD
jgi:general secretion pathway protein B